MWQRRSGFERRGTSRKSREFRWTLSTKMIGKLLFIKLEKTHNFYRRRIRERMKTVSVALVLCLNIGVDPPDSLYPNQGRKLAWVRPNIASPQRTSQKITSHLQKLYEKLHPRARYFFVEFFDSIHFFCRYKHVVDPTIELVEKLCKSLRRNANSNDRVLFHFNGYGVPKPTQSGEIWVFNKNLSQVIF